MSYRKGKYRVEEYEHDGDTFYQIRFKDLDDPLTSKITEDNERIRWETKEEAVVVAEEQIES